MIMALMSDSASHPLDYSDRRQAHTVFKQSLYNPDYSQRIKKI